MKGYLSLPDLRAAIERAVAGVCSEAGVDASIRVDITHPQRFGARHGVELRVEVEREGFN